MVEGGGDPYEWPPRGFVQARVPSDLDGAGPIPAGQGPQDKSRWAGCPRLVRGQSWVNGGGWGVFQNGGGRGPRWPAVEPESLHECNKPSDLEAFHVTRRRAHFWEVFPQQREAGGEDSPPGGVRW